MPEQKPITNSRDTQELLRDAGVEVLTIMSTFREKTSLLHDYGYYEVSRVSLPMTWVTSFRFVSS